MRSPVRLPHSRPGGSRGAPQLSHARRCFRARPACSPYPCTGASARLGRPRAPRRGRKAIRMRLRGPSRRIGRARRRSDRRRRGGREGVRSDPSAVRGPRRTSRLPPECDRCRRTGGSPGSSTRRRGKAGRGCRRRPRARTRGAPLRPSRRYSAADPPWTARPGWRVVTIRLLPHSQRRLHRRAVPLEEAGAKDARGRGRRLASPRPRRAALRPLRVRRCSC